MEVEIKLLADGYSFFGTVLEQNATCIRNVGEYYYLPYWFEKTENDKFIAHKLSDNFPRDLAQAIEDFKEDVNTKLNK